MIEARVQVGSFRYGAGFLDATTGLRFEGHHPSERPDLWRRYLDGAEASYEQYGLSALIDREELGRGESVTLFFVGMDTRGQIRAGMRCHGPLDAAAASRALAEMNDSPEMKELQRSIEQSIPYGVIELKGAWGSIEGPGAYLVTRTLARCGIYALSWLRSELALGAVADYLREPLSESGAQMIGTSGVAYPSPEYKTVLMSWGRARVAAQSDPEQAEMLRVERNQLMADSTPSARTIAGTSSIPLRDSSGWRPIILEESERAERAIIEVLRHDKNVEFLDHLTSQRAELRQLHAPGAADLLDEPSRFVYFPWRDALVRMVGPGAYSALRTDRNRNKITSEEQERLRTLKVGVVGLSVGHAIAHLLAMEGLCHQMRLADFDWVETTNLNRIPGTVFDLGINKAVVAARRIAELDPYLDVEVLDHGIQGDNVAEFMADLDLIIEECDSLDVKVLVREAARERGIPVMMATSDRGLFDVERFDLDRERPSFHGLLPDISAADLAGLPMSDKVPHVLSILDPDQISARGAASLVEVGATITTWPQLGGDVLLGAATAAAALRRLGRGEPLPSGRVRIDLDDTLEHATDPTEGVRENVRRTEAASDPELPNDPDTAIAVAASRAPSGGNAQPWRFELEDNEFRIHLVAERSSTMDVAFRGSFVAIGAALFNARVAAAAQGRLGSMDVDSERASRGPVAILRLEQGVDTELAAFYPNLLTRCANRHLGDRSAIDADTQAILHEEVRREGGVMHLVTEPGALVHCADLLGASERLRFLSPALHKEMLGELRRPGIDSLETGIDVRSLELEPADLATLAVARRGDVMAQLDRWNAGSALGRNAQKAIRSSSALGVVAVDRATPSAFVTGGRAMERLWLAADRAGLAVQPVSPVFLYALQSDDYAALVGEHHSEELQQLSTEFWSAVGLGEREVAILVFRFSAAPAPTVASLRLPLTSTFRQPNRRESAADQRVC